MKIALIAHDGKKADMVHFLSGFRDALHRVDIDLVATGTTGSHIEKAGFQVERLLSGPLGGDAQIAALAAEKKLAAVIFFRDPTTLLDDVHKMLFWVTSTKCPIWLTSTKCPFG